MMKKARELLRKHVKSSVQSVERPLKLPFLRPEGDLRPEERALGEESTSHALNLYNGKAGVRRLYA